MNYMSVLVFNEKTDIWIEVTPYDKDHGSGPASLSLRKFLSLQHE